MEVGVGRKEPGGGLLGVAVPCGHGGVEEAREGVDAVRVLAVEWGGGVVEEGVGDAEVGGEAVRVEGELVGEVVQGLGGVGALSGEVGGVGLFEQVVGEPHGSLYAARWGWGVKRWGVGRTPWWTGF